MPGTEVSGIRTCRLSQVDRFDINALPVGNALPVENRDVWLGYLPSAKAGHDRIGFVRKRPEVPVGVDSEMWNACRMVRTGALSAEDFAEAVWRHFESRPPLGELAAKHGLLSMKQVFAVLEKQADDKCPFGQTSIELGLLSKEQVDELLLLQAEMAIPVREIVDELLQGAQSAPTR
ncbi:MAG: hypothetical protein R3C10_10755 [Pirellulales bacterium]